MVAQKLEAAGCWRRASARWLFVMGNVECTEAQREWLLLRREYCLAQISSPPPAYFHERRSLNNFHRDRVITFEQIAE
ncbi:PerC family transcriptional regulator [Escherichia coli]|uniref:PerC family transcriptional regulator n=1 Tax=Escherichia coli TaxID=562 RepID=UPI001F0443ED|nr:PerC family transcriptional regulator [Escherichia coli]